MNNSKINLIHILNDPQNSFSAIIAIKGNEHHQSIGGCRIMSYENFQQALDDATNLAIGMYFKTSLFGLPFNGGKAVLINNNSDREYLLHSLGTFINNLSGTYVTGLDIGVDQSDMNLIKQKTEFVAEDCIEATVEGVLQSLKEVIKYRFKTEIFKGMKIAIQGLGKTGSKIGERLHQLGANLIVSEVDQNKLQQFTERVPCKVADPEDIYSSDCDIFIPCANGGILNLKNISRMKVSVILGPANRQIGGEQIDEILKNRNILYCPEVIVSSGGVIYAATQYLTKDHAKAWKKIEMIRDVLNEYFLILANNKCTSQIALNLLYKERGINY